MKKNKKNRKRIVINTIKNHIYNNKKEYLIAGIIFIIGIILGVMFINQADYIKKEEIGQYISTFVNCIKTDYEINTNELIKSSLINNIILALIIWFMGSTVIGIPVVYATIGIRGFCLGYTISSIIYTYGIGKGILLCISSLLLQNILFIPAILALAVSGIKLYKAITKDKRKENIKLEICRHTIFSTIVTILLILSSLIEVYISTNLLMRVVNVL